jgi:hypothetical protein
MSYKIAIGIDDVFLSALPCSIEGAGKVYGNVPGNNRVVWK